MEIYVGTRDTKQSFNIDEVAIVCSFDALKRFKAFLEAASMEHAEILEKNEIEEGEYIWHSHYQDFIDRWNANDSDFVLDLFK